MKAAVYFLMASPLSALARSLAGAPGPAQAPLALRTPTVGCQPLDYARNVPLPDGFVADPLLEWSDSDCATRRAALLSNAQPDPTGHFGGVLHELTYQHEGDEVVCTGSTQDHPGIGNAVNHFQLPDGTFDSDSSLSHPGNATTLLRGPHHGLHSYQWTYPIAGFNASLRVDWLLGTGLSHPVFACTYDLSAIPANALSADIRAPYGDIDFDGGQGAVVTGVEWGGNYKFRSIARDGVNLMLDGWDNTQPNTVPYAAIYAQDADREMGYVSTHTLAEQDAGAGEFYSEGGTQNLTGPMPVDYNWVHQAGQYDYATNPASKRLAWQLNYGALGQQQYDDFLHTQQPSGWPHHSHSVAAVFGPRSHSAVQAQVAHVEALSSAQLTARAGVRVLTEGPAGIGRTDTLPYVPAGYSKVYGTFELAAVDNPRKLAFDLRTPQGALQGYMVRVHQWSTPALPQSVRVNGRTLPSNSVNGYFATVDAEQQILWLTVARPQPPHAHLSGGAVAGIVLGTLSGASALGAAGYLLYRSRQQAAPAPGAA